MDMRFNIMGIIFMMVAIWLGTMIGSSVASMLGFAGGIIGAVVVGFMVYIVWALISGQKINLMNGVIFAVLVYIAQLIARMIFGATGFGGGMHINGTCGAVTGAVMVLGLKYSSTEEGKQAKENTYRKVIEFANKFSVRNSTVKCQDLLGCDITTVEGIQIAREKGLFSSICPRLVQDAAEILEEMLAEDDD